MKKFLLSVATATLSLGAFASDYTGQLNVSVTDEESGETYEVFQETSITLEEVDGKYNFTLKNFLLSVEDEETGDVDYIPVGNIAVEGLEATEAAGYKTLKFNNSVQIAEGEDEALPEGYDAWFGPFLGDVPIDLVAKFNDAALTVNISINLTILPQAIKVGFIGTNPDAIGGSDDGRSPSDVNKDDQINVADVNIVLTDILNEVPAFPNAE